MAARLMEAFAGYTAQTDFQVGRVLDALEAIGQMDNTLVIWVIGDNGASMEGSLHGVFNEMVSLNGQEEDPRYILAHLDEIGGPKAYNHYPGRLGVGDGHAVPVGQAGRLALRRHAQPDGHLMAGPHQGQRRHPHAVPPRDRYRADNPGSGRRARSLGASTAWRKSRSKASAWFTRFDDAKANGTHRTQYFEMFGNRAIYNDGWVACVRHGRLPWQTPALIDFDKDTWELYNIDDDFSEANDRAAKEPQRMREMQDLFWVEAAKYDVLPLNDRMIERADPSLRPSLIAGRTDFTYFPGATRIPESSSPYVKNRSHTITVHVDVPKTGGDGVLVAAGGVVGGYVLHVKDGKPTYEYNWFSQQRYRVESSETLPAGPATIRAEFKYDGGGLGKGGLITLFVNDKKVGEGRVEKTILGRYSADETFDIGMDTGSPVSDGYKSPNPYTGALRKVEIHLAAANHTENEIKTMRKADLAVELSKE